MTGPFDWLQQMLGGSPEGTGLGYASSQSSPDMLQYAQDVLSGKMAASGPIGQARYDPNKSFGQNVMDPAAHEAAMSMLGPLAIRAYHASPFDFTKFKANPRAGTGGLSQGYGTYVAEAEPVSLDYLKQFKERSAKWEPPTGTTASTPFNDVLLAAERVKGNVPHSALIPHPQEVYGNLVSGLKRGDSLDSYLDYVKNAGWEPQKQAMYQAAIDAMRGWKWNPGKGHMYEVDVHADPHKFLNWDLPLGQQTNAVENAVRDITRQSNIPISPMGEMVGARAYQDMAEYFRRSGMPEDEAYRLVSELLQKEGVPGTRYADMFSRNLPDAAGRQYIEQQIADIQSRIGLSPAVDPGLRHEIEVLQRQLVKPTYNMAVTDPGIIEIARKYGLLPPLAAGAAGGLLGPAEE